MRFARPVALDAEQRAILERQARARSLAARVVERSKIVLLAAEAKPDLEIASQLGISPKKAARWRNRFLDVGMKGLEKDAARPGRTPSIPASLVQRVIEKTTQSKPANARHTGPHEPWPRNWGLAIPAFCASGGHTGSSRI